MRSYSHILRKLPKTAKGLSLFRFRFASSLVIAEHDYKVLSPGTLSTITAASKIGGDISVLVTGKGVEAVAKQAAAVENVSKVLIADNESLDHSLAEDMSSLIKAVCENNNFTHILAPSSNNGKNFIPRVAAQLDCSPLMDILAVVDENTFKRPMYAGNAIATVKMSNAFKFLLVRATAFEKAAEATATSAPIESLPASITDALTKSPLSEFLSDSSGDGEDAAAITRPDLTAARVVVSGGRGLKNGENFSMLEALADKLGGAVGASRAAVDAGFVPNEYQVGQTGKVVAPDLYIAVGISGAIQHLSGMKDSKTIVAINKDKEAPIFQVADYGLVDDLFKAVPDLTSKL